MDTYGMEALMAKYNLLQKYIKLFFSQRHTNLTVLLLKQEVWMGPLIISSECFTLRKPTVATKAEDAKVRLEPKL